MKTLIVIALLPLPTVASARTECRSYKTAIDTKTECVRTEGGRRSVQRCSTYRTATGERTVCD